VLEASQGVTALRASLPMGVDLSDPDVLGPHLGETVAALRDYLDDVDVAGVAARVGRSLRSATRPEPIGPLAQLAAAGSLTADTPLRLRVGMHPSVEVSDTGVTIVVLDRRVELPLVASGAVKTVLSGEVFTPSELSGDDPLELARRLLTQGLIVTA